MKQLTAILFVLLFAIPPLAQKKVKSSDKEYTTAKGIVVNADSTYTLGTATGEKFTAIYHWSIVPNMREPLPASYSGHRVKIVRFRTHADIMYALFDIRGQRYGIGVEAAVAKNELLVSTKKE
ncbi:MAG: hypothetical protein ACOYVG_10210 [Bacteroidota bacterium]